MIITGELCYYLRTLNPDLYRTKKMLSTIVNFADNNGALTWLLDLLIKTYKLIDVHFDSILALSTLICVSSSPLLSLFVLTTQRVVGNYAQQSNLPWHSLHNRKMYVVRLLDLEITHAALAFPGYSNSLLGTYVVCGSYRF